MGLIITPTTGSRHGKTMFGRDVRKLEAYHESRHTEDVKDEVAVAMFSDEFLGDMESNGSRRAVMADLGFNMEKEAEDPEHIPIDLGKGYCTFDHTLVKDADGLDAPKGYKVIKGKGKGHIFFQGDKHGEA